MAKLCPHCAAVLPNIATTCIGCGSVTAGSISLLPPIVRENSERREVTVLFCDLGGYTQWLDEEDPEEVASVVDGIRRKAIVTFEAFGGVANQFVGDEVLGLFGLPASYEDDALRGVVAAHALHAYVREQRVMRRNGEPRALLLHTGLETGLVYARVRDPRSGLYDVTGDPVNVAARLRSLAQRDEILVGPSAGPRVAPYFLLEPLEATLVRGKPQPIQPYRVLGRSSVSSRFDAACARGLTPYVGRQHELHVLRSAWEQACRGRGELITIAGSAGIGKTRLLFELRRAVATAPEAAAPLILQARCSPYANVAPYQVFIDAIQAAFTGESNRTEAAADLATWMQSLGPLSQASFEVLRYLLTTNGARPRLSSETVGAPLRTAIVDALLELVCVTSARRPVLVMLEDWHSADEPSRTALRALAERLDQHRVLVAINYRPTELSEQGRFRAALHLELAALDWERTETLARQVIGVSTLPRGLAEFIHARTLGNPFFVEEFCRSLREKGAFVQHSDSITMVEPLSKLATPSTVQSIVRARVDRLPLEEKQLLRIASAAGLEFRVDFVEVLLYEQDGSRRQLQVAESGSYAYGAQSPIAQVRTMLTRLESQGLVSRIGASVPAVYRFQHAITQEVVYSSLSMTDRRDYHGRLGELLETRFPVESREPHYEALAHHYGLSLRKEKAVEYALLAATKAWHSFSLEQADHQYSQALKLFEGLQPLDDDRKRTYIDANVNWAKVAIYNPRKGVVTTLRTSLLWARELRDEQRICLCLDWMTWMEYALGHQADALACSREFLEAAKVTHDDRFLAQAYTNIGLCHAIATNYDDAIAAIERGIQIRARFVGTAYGYAMGILAQIQGDRGDFAAAFAGIARAAPSGNAAGRLTLEGPVLIQRAMIECWQGAFAQCMESARLAQAIGERIQGTYILAMSLALGAYARLMTAGDVDAIDQIREAVDMLERNCNGLHLSLVYGLLAEGLATVGAYDGALTAADRVDALAAQRDSLGETSGLRVRALVAARKDRDRAQTEHFMRRALASAEAKRSPREAAITKLRWAEVLATSLGEPAPARDLVGEASVVFEALGMTFYATAGRKLVDGLGGSLEPEH